MSYVSPGKKPNMAQALESMAPPSNPYPENLGGGMAPHAGPAAPKGRLGKLGGLGGGIVGGLFGIQALMSLLGGDENQDPVMGGGLAMPQGDPEREHIAQLERMLAGSRGVKTEGAMTHGSSELEELISGHEEELAAASIPFPKSLRQRYAEIGVIR